MAEIYQPRVRTFDGFRSTEKPAADTQSAYKRFTTANGKVFLRHRDFEVEFASAVMSILRETKSSTSIYKNGHGISAIEQFVRLTTHWQN